MNKEKLGQSDLNITRIGIGAWAIGGGQWEFAWGPQNDDASIHAIYAGLVEFAETYHVTSAHFTAIGALNRATLGWFDPQRKMYKKIAINGQHEVLG
jgi:hypothetical protein